MFDRTPDRISDPRSQARRLQALRDHLDLNGLDSSGQPRGLWEFGCELSRLDLFSGTCEQVEALVAKDFALLCQQLAAEAGEAGEGRATGDNLSPTERRLAALRWEPAFVAGGGRADMEIARKVLLSKRGEFDLTGLWLACAVPSARWLSRPPREAIAHYGKLVDADGLVKAWQELGYLQGA